MTSRTRPEPDVPPADPGVLRSAALIRLKKLHRRIAVVPGPPWRQDDWDAIHEQMDEIGNLLEQLYAC